MNNLVNSYYDDCYFSIDNGYLESKYVFIEGNNITLTNGVELNIGETGFGTGLNLLVLEDNIKKSNCKNIKLTFTTVEKYPLDVSYVKNALTQLKQVSHESLASHLEIYEKLNSYIKSGWNSLIIKRTWGELKLNLFFGDIVDSFSNYPVKNSSWFLDGHSPDKNPDMWNETVFALVANNSIKGASFATFTAAGIVKQGLRSAGFFVKRKKGFGKKRHMIFGYLENNKNII